MTRLTKNNPAVLDIGVFFVLILWGLALYFVPLHSNSFYFDDVSSIESNEAIRTIDLPKIFNAFNTRSLVGLSFAINYKWGGLHPFGYRLINLLFHCLNAFLVFLLIKLTLQSKWPAFFASILFLCHPIQTEPVNYITQRFVLMGAFFYLLTLVLYIQYRCWSQKNYLIAAFGSAVAAMFCKEFTVTLPLMLTLYELYFLNCHSKAQGRRISIWMRSFASLRMTIPFFVIALIVPILLLRTPKEMIGVASIAESRTHHIDITRAQGNISRKQYFLTELNVVRTYVRLLFLPIDQDLDYDYPLSHDIDKKTLLSGIFLLCLLAIAVITYKSYRIVSFGILWFFIALSVESSVIPIGHPIAEYRLYLASVGFVFFLTALLYMRPIDQKKVPGTISKKLFLAPFLILIGFSILTFQRNNIWKDDFSLWNDVVQKSPHKARAYNNRGLAFAQQGNLTQAIADYDKAIAIDPYYINAYINSGFASNKQGNFAAALSDYNKAIALNPQLAEVYIDRGNTYFYQGNYILALSDYNKAIELKPNLAEGYNGRANAYLKLNNFTQSLSDYNKALELKPDYADAYYNRTICYYQLKKYGYTIKMTPAAKENH